MAINKVEYGGDTLIDLTEDTVTADTMLSGVTAHSKSGEQIVGSIIATETIELTKAEYDALPATKLTDGKHYFITDYSEGGGGGGSSDFTYSTEEQYTGLRWLDGKKIYQKTFVYNNITMTNTGDLQTDLDNMDKCWFHELLFENGNEFIVSPIMDISGLAILSYRVILNASRHATIKICGNTSWAASTSRTYNITLRYTKMNE